MDMVLLAKLEKTVVWAARVADAMCNHPARNCASGMLWKQLEESYLEEVLLQSPQEASFLQVRLGGQGARYFSGGNSSLFPL